MPQIKNPVTGQLFTPTGDIKPYTDKGWTVIEDVKTPPAPVNNPNPNNNTPIAPAPTQPPISRPINTFTPTPQKTYKDNLGESVDLLTSKAQSEISSIEQAYKGMIDTSNEQEKGREAGISALLGTGAIAGTSAAAAASRGSQSTSRSEQAKQTADFATTVASIYDKINTNAVSIANNLNVDQANIKASAMSAIDTFATAGKSSDDIKNADPNFYQNLLNQTGMTEYQLSSYIDTNPNNPNKKVTKEIPMPSEDGQSTIIKRITFDPKTGKSTESDYTANVPFASFQGQGLVTTSEGKLLQQQSDGSYKDITPGISGATTTTQKDYEYYVKQEKANNKTPLSFDQWTANQKAPAAVKEFLAAQASGFKGTILEYQQQKKGAGTSLDADTLQFFADKFLVDGQMPAFGMGVAGMTARAQFYKTVADTATSKGLGGQSVAAQQAGVAAAKAALIQVQKLSSTTTTAEETAKKNLDYAYELGKEYERTGYPGVNKFENWLSEAGLSGQAKQGAYTEFEVALYTGVREYAKVASGAAGSVSGLTDSAIKEATDLVNQAFSQGQLKSAIDTISRDMKNVEQSQTDTINNLKDQIGGTGSTTPTPPTPTGGKTGGGGSGDDNFDSIWN